MKKFYEPGAIESRWYKVWESAGDFRPQGKGRPYCIMLPPPNVTGTLHMGHAFQDTVMDCLVRYHRMCGRRVLWQAGTDHAGIATQMVVERQIEAQGHSRKVLGREKFVEKVWEWKHQSGRTITQQLRRLGASLDWTRECFTLDESLSASVTKAFLSLYDKGLIYRGKRLVNWDPVLKTAVSDLEVLTREEDGHLWHIRYPLQNGGAVTVATTRPETMLGDTAVAVHPEDTRYRKFVGQTVELPLTGRHIPVIADSYVDPEFGSGCVKITPAHDFNDYEVGQRHGLELINVMHPDASLNNNAPAPYRGLDRYRARKKIIADLERGGLLEKVEKRKIMIPRGDRSGEVVEPLLTDQWFVRVETLAQKARAAVTRKRIRFVPQNWEKTYFEWMNNIQDWCISRQLWWGHRIPAWYDGKGNCYVGESEAQVRERYRLSDEIQLEQDEDVLDTWFSSALWPFSTLGWPQRSADLKDFYPGNVLVTGFDIIFVWVARMIMLGLEFMDEVPFRDVYVHGLVLDMEGRKMSKSKGNVIDPIDLIDGISLDRLLEKRVSSLMQAHQAKSVRDKTRQQFPEGIPAYGTDALRFTFTAMASGNRDIRFDLRRIEGYRNFCNKLWNAARYVMMNCKDTASAETRESSLPADVWMRERSSRLIEETAHCFDEYRFDLIAGALYEFVWHDYCDWYLEFSKIILQSPHLSETQKQAHRGYLIRTVETVLRLLHPIIPFITEELWHQIKPLSGRQEHTIQQRPYPHPGTVRHPVSSEDKKAAEEITWLRELVTAVRSKRSEMDLPPDGLVNLYLKAADAEVKEQDDKARFARHEDAIRRLARIDNIVWTDEAEKQGTVVVIGGRLKACIVPQFKPSFPEKEPHRLDLQIVKLNGKLQILEKRLADANFIAKAPQEVVAKHKKQAHQLKIELENLETQRRRQSETLP